MNLVGNKLASRKFKRKDKIRNTLDPRFEAIVVGYIWAITQSRELFLVEYTKSPQSVSNAVIGTVNFQYDHCWELIP